MPTETLTHHLTSTPTVSATPTYAFPTVTVNKQAHCRYGPSVAYTPRCGPVRRGCGNRPRAVHLQQMAVSQIRQVRTTFAG
ncbi:MAG: hypothetical protein MZV64_23195 [Ignavibacteriales bacterium]|nr:hypothetical protein [Ignavibacteriales bacterium]